MKDSFTELLIKQTKLSERWIAFFKIILDPWIIITSVLLILLIQSSRGADSEVLRYILTLLVAGLSILIGALFIRKWMDIHEIKAMVVRGKLSIRSLKLLYFNLIQTEGRAEKFIRRLNEKDLNYELIKSNFEEIIEKCKLLEEECLNSIEDWSDIIEDADVKAKLSKLKLMDAECARLEMEIAGLERSISDNTNIAEEEKNAIRQRIEGKKTELKQVQSVMHENEIEINSSVLSGMTGSNLPKDTIFSIYKSCPSCGSFYSGSYICPFCGEPSKKRVIN